MRHIDVNKVKGVTYNVHTMSYYLSKEIDDWLQDNQINIRFSKMNPFSTKIVFDCLEDAMAFKLRWM